MIKKEILSLIFVLANLTNVFGQRDFAVQLKRTQGSYPSAISMWMEGGNNFDKTFFKGISDSIQSLRIVYLDFHGSQGAFERYVKHKMKKGDAEILEQNDTTRLSRIPINHGMFFLTGFCKGLRIIIPDLNYNKDFSDDKAMLFSKFDFRNRENFNQNYPENLLTVNYEYYEKELQRVVLKTLILEVLPNNPFVLAGKNMKDTEYDFFIRIAENRTGRFNLNNNCYELVVSPATGSLDDYEYDFRLYVDSCNYKFKRKYMSDELITKQQKIKIEENYYLITLNRFGDTAFFKNFGQNKFRVVNRDRVVEGILDKIDLSRYKGKYLIIDFWGTWCQPCLKLMPNMMKINDFIDKSKVDIIGVAYDSDKKKVQDFLAQKKYSWVNIFEDMKKTNAANSLVKELNIGSFPTVMLIGKDGKILEEKLPIENLFEIKRILSTYIK